MSKNELNNLIIKIFLLNSREKKKLNKKNLIVKNLQNYDSLRFMKFLTTIEEKYKIDISPKNFEIFFNTDSIYEYLEKIKNKKSIK
jgi:acyl carrier protein